MAAQSTQRVDFRELINFIVEGADDDVQRAVVEKEVLHYDILNVLDSSGLLKALVLQGGTSLRLCRGLNRFSEDLRFAGGPDFTFSKLEQIKACIEKSLRERYGLHTYVKQPSELYSEPDYENIKFSKWQIGIASSLGNQNILKEEIKIDITNVPAYTEEVLPIRDNYPVFGGGRMPVLVRVATINEILADKVVAFPMFAQTIRHRDIWDIAWLQHKGARLDPEMVKVKLRDYKIDDIYELMLEKAIDNLPSIVESKEFSDQMNKLIKRSVADATPEKRGFKQYLLNENQKIFKLMQLALKPEPVSKNASATEFKM